MSRSSKVQLGRCTSRRHSLKSQAGIRCCIYNRVGRSTYNSNCLRGKLTLLYTRPARPEQDDERNKKESTQVINKKTYNKCKHKPYNYVLLSAFNIHCTFSLFHCSIYFFCILDGLEIKIDPCFQKNLFFTNTSHAIKFWLLDSHVASV